MVVCSSLRLHFVLPPFLTPQFAPSLLPVALGGHSQSSPVTPAGHKGIRAQGCGICTHVHLTLLTCCSSKFTFFLYFKDWDKKEKKMLQGPAGLAQTELWPPLLHGNPALFTGLSFVCFSKRCRGDAVKSHLQTDKYNFFKTCI